MVNGQRHASIPLWKSILHRWDITGPFMTFTWGSRPENKARFLKIKNHKNSRVDLSEGAARWVHQDDHHLHSTLVLERRSSSSCRCGYRRFHPPFRIVAYRHHLPNYSSAMPSVAIRLCLARNTCHLCVFNQVLLTLRCTSKIILYCPTSKAARRLRHLAFNSTFASSISRTCSATSTDTANRFNHVASAEINATL